MMEVGSRSGIIVFRRGNRLVATSLWSALVTVHVAALSFEKVMKHKQRTILKTTEAGRSAGKNLNPKLHRGRASVEDGGVPENFVNETSAFVQVGLKRSCGAMCGDSEEALNDGTLATSQLGGPAWFLENEAMILDPAGLGSNGDGCAFTFMSCQNERCCASALDACVVVFDAYFAMCVPHKDATYAWVFDKDTNPAYRQLFKSDGDIPPTISENTCTDGFFAKDCDQTQNRCCLENAGVYCYQADAAANLPFTAMCRPACGQDNFPCAGCVSPECGTSGAPTPAPEGPGPSPPSPNPSPSGGGTGTGSSEAADCADDKSGESCLEKSCCAGLTCHKKNEYWSACSAATNCCTFVQQIGEDVNDWECCTPELLEQANLAGAGAVEEVQCGSNSTASPWPMEASSGTEFRLQVGQDPFATSTLPSVLTHPGTDTYGHIDKLVWDQKFGLSHYWDCCTMPGCAKIGDGHLKVANPSFAPYAPTDAEKSAYGEKLWVTAAASDFLRQLEIEDLDPARHPDPRPYCFMVRYRDSLGGEDFNVMVRVTNSCQGDANPLCKAPYRHLDIAAPGFDTEAASSARYEYGCECKQKLNPFQKGYFDSEDQSLSEQERIKLAFKMMTIQDLALYGYVKDGEIKDTAKEICEELSSRKHNDMPSGASFQAGCLNFLNWGWPNTGPGNNAWKNDPGEGDWRDEPNDDCTATPTWNNPYAEGAVLFDWDGKCTPEFERRLACDTLKEPTNYDDVDQQVWETSSLPF
ncbi:unnamed protein product [Amoebophrya sp. A120]|nr:unnamed protein product [Amoebophrya sp. A120]|eukprot:GSA120T00003870001.1